MRSDLTEDLEWRPNPLLPFTLGEIAVPIKLREDVLGVLDVQSDQPGALSEEDQLLLEGLCGQIASAIESTRLRLEMEERLKELDALYRAMSREGWETFRKAPGRQTAYLFDQTAVQPAGDMWEAETQRAMDQRALSQAETGQPVVAAPLSVRGDVVGALAVQDNPQKPLSAEEMELVEAISDQIGLALEDARLFEQTQNALAETETLYGIIAEMNAAQSYDEILNALAQRTLLARADKLLVMGLFDQPLNGSSRPEWIFPVAYQADGAIEIAQRYPLSAFEAKPNTLFTDRPVILEDMAADRRLDKVTRTLFQDVFQAQSSIVIPLMIGAQAIGFVQGYFSAQVSFSQAEVQRLSAVAGQAAIAVQSRLLLERAQSRARQEERIREVTAQVFGAADVDTIMRRAVEQVGRVLGLPAFIYLGEGGNQPTIEGEGDVTSD
jgi:GAF domain-containing protein